MNRRDFLKHSILASAALSLPMKLSARDIDISRVNFNHNRYAQNSAQTIMIFLYGGPSELAGNLTNIDAIKQKSQSSYDNYFRGITPTANHCWQEAGGRVLESMLAEGDLNLFRTCYSEVREQAGNKSHGICVAQNQRGLFDTEGAGIFTTLARVLLAKGVLSQDSLLPFVTMEGDSSLFAAAEDPLPGYLRPVGIDRALSNPYERENTRRWFYYTDEEREQEDYDKSAPPALDLMMDTLAQQHNPAGKIKEAFSKRGELEQFIDRIKARSLPEGVTYPNNNLFAEKLESAIKILVANPDTKIVSLGSGGLGGWDDHNEARDYVSRCESLFTALQSAMAHIKAEGKENSITIMVFGDFGRNVNLNSALGWDHGNNQNFYLLGGKGYFNHLGVVGETELVDTGSLNRLYLHPKEGSYWFEPVSIAATLYKMYGIENPEILTGGYGPIGANLFK